VTASPPERRAHVRYQFATSSSNPPLATIGVIPRAALIANLSATGLGLLTTVSPPIGAIVPVWLPGPPGLPSSLILATIIHVTPDGALLHQVGLACREESLGVLGDVLDRFPTLGWTAL
jgi:hypothetical protein